MTVAKLARLPALPKPDANAPIPHPDDWAAWCEHPVTRFIATAMKSAAEQQRAAWLAASWGAGHADPQALIELRTRADAYMAFLETPMESYAKILEA